MNQQDFNDFRDDFNGLNSRPLKKAELSGGSAAENGYQKIDDTTVLERKNFDIGWRRKGTILYIYDFRTRIMVTTFDTSGGATAPCIMPFSAVENPQVIMDAHRALCELGGTPCDITDIFPATIRLDKPVPSESRIHIRKKEDGTAPA